MLDSTMPPDMGAELRKLSSRLERLEMSQRVVRGYNFAFIYPAYNALSVAAGLAPQGSAGSYTDQAAYADVLAGDFVGTGENIEGAVYYWLPPAHTMSVRVRVSEYGGTPVTIHERTGITATGPGDFWSTTIPDSCLAPLSTAVRGGLFRLAIQVKRDAGADRVGVAISSTPFTYPS